MEPLCPRGLRAAVDVPSRVDLAAKAAQSGSDIYIASLVQAMTETIRPPIDIITGPDPWGTAHDRQSGPDSPRGPPEPPEPPEPPMSPTSEPALRSPRETWRSTPTERQRIRTLVGSLAQPLDHVSRCVAARVVPPGARAGWRGFPAAQLESEMFGVLDICNHRLDAWFTSLASRRLATLRSDDTTRCRDRRMGMPAGRAARRSAQTRSSAPSSFIRHHWIRRRPPPCCAAVHGAPDAAAAITPTSISRRVGCGWRGGSSKACATADRSASSSASGSSARSRAHRPRRSSAICARCFQGSLAYRRARRPRAAAGGTTALERHRRRCGPPRSSTNRWTQWRTRSRPKRFIRSSGAIPRAR